MLVRQTDGQMERWRDRVQNKRAYGEMKRGVSPSHCLHPGPDTESFLAESTPPDQSTITQTPVT